MASSSSSHKSTRRRRPAYMLLFIDYLRRHNNAQPKFVPGRRSSQQHQQQRSRSQQRERLASSSPMSITDSQALMGPGAVRRSQRSSKASSSTAASRSTDRTSAPKGGGGGGSNLGAAAGGSHRTSQLFNQKSPSHPDEQPAASVSPVALLAQYFRLPDFFSRRQAAPAQTEATGNLAPQADNTTPGSPASPTSPAESTQTQTPEKPVQSPPPAEAKTIEPVVTINSNPDAPDHQHTKDTTQPQSPTPPVQQAEQPPAAPSQPQARTDEPTPPATQQPTAPPIVAKLSAPATPTDQKSASNSNSQQMVPAVGSQTLRLPRIKGFRTSALASATKESNPPSLTQTPAAGVGASGSNQQQALHPPLITSTQQHQLARMGIGCAKPVQTPGARSGGATSSQPAQQLTAEQQKKISIARAVAEQTPNANELLGPGFAVRMPGEHSEGNRDNNNNNKQNAANKTGPLETIPSDYEHIFHATSNLVDESLPQQQEQPTHTQTSPPPPPPQIIKPKVHPSPGPKREKVKTPANKPTHHPKAGKDHQEHHHHQNKKGQKPAAKKARVKKQK